MPFIADSIRWHHLQGLCYKSCSSEITHLRSIFLAGIPLSSCGTACLLAHHPPPPAQTMTGITANKICTPNVVLVLGRHPRRQPITKPTWFKVSKPFVFGATASGGFTLHWQCRCHPVSIMFLTHLYCVPLGPGNMKKLM